MAINHMLWEIISRLPLRFAVQCKLLSPEMNSMISNPDFVKVLVRREKETSTQLIYSLPLRRFCKIFLKPITQSVTLFPDFIEVLASCNGLILLEFERTGCYCVFNPITGAHQLIQYPTPSTNDLEQIGLAVDYPTLDQYKLVAISNLDENSNRFYKFHVLSSEQPGLWREIRLATNSFLSLPFGSPPVYWRDSLYWLRRDGSVIAFDTKSEEAILIDRPEFLDHYDLIYGKISRGQDIWLGIAQDLLTLVCIFRRYIVTATYDSASSRWRVSQPMDNFILRPEGILNGFPVWIDSKPVSFLVQRHAALDYELHEYDTNIHVYENVAVLRRVHRPMLCFHPTLASVHWTPFNNITADDQAYIDANLDGIRRFINEGTPIEEEISSEESSSSSSGGGGEEAEAGDEGEEEQEAPGGEAGVAGGGGEEEEEISSEESSSSSSGGGEEAEAGDGGEEEQEAPGGEAGVAGGGGEEAGDGGEEEAEVGGGEEKAEAEAGARGEEEPEAPGGEAAVAGGEGGEIL